MIQEGKVKRIEIEAVITRADGRVENLGTVSYWDKNMFKRAWWNIKMWFKRMFKKENETWLPYFVTPERQL